MPFRTATRRNIGLFINQMDGRYQSQLWQGILSVLSQQDHNLLIFSGKSPQSPLENEAQYNVIYKLARPEILDALIVTSGTLSNYSGEAEFLKFLEPYQHLPKVSISLPLKGMPSLLVDNRQGMNELLHHLWFDHGYRSIGYIGGPETNPEALERLAAFRAFMEEHGGGYNPDYYAEGDFREFGARTGLETLLDKRGLKLDCLVLANDDMALAAYRALKLRGISVPEDMALTGFDDIGEMKYFTPGFTTVRQPIYEQGRMAASLVLSLLKGETTADAISLPTRLVVRDSCGCGRKTDAIKDGAGQTAVMAGSLKELPVQTARDLEIHTIEEQHWRDLATQFDKAVSAQNTGLFTTAVIDFLARFPGESVDNWRRCLGKLHQVLKNSQPWGVLQESIFSATYSLLVQKAEKTEGFQKMQMEELLNITRLVTLRMNTANTLVRLTDVLKNNLPVAKIQGVSICLYQTEHESLTGTDWKLPPFARLIMSYSGERVTVEPGTVITYPVKDLLPRLVNQDDRPMTLLFLPLFIRNEHFGFIAYEMSGQNEIIYETMRELISNAIQSTITYRKRRRAEEKLRVALEVLQKSEERYKEMAVLLPTILLETDLQKRIVFLNQAGMDAFGVTEADLQRGLNITEIIFKDDLSRFNDYSRGIMEGHPPAYNEFRLQKRDGTKLVLLSKAIPLFQNRKISGIRWSAIDIKPLLTNTLSPDDEFFKPYDFSKREQEVLKYILQGLKIKDIAEKMFVTESTVKGHITSLYSKMGIKNKQELFELLRDRQAHRQGYDSFMVNILTKLIQD